MLSEKRCPKCDTVKPAASFYKSAKRHDGLSSYCRQCQVSDAKSRYSPHPRWKAPEGEKWCPGCQDTRPLDAFGNNRKSHDGKQARCKPCSVASVTKSRRKDPTSHRESSKRWRANNPDRHYENNLRSRIGAHVEHGTYAELLAGQGGRCAICQTDKPGNRGGRFSMDHCKVDGHVRGLLCGLCNTGIGALGHNKAILEAAMKYLAGFDTKPTR